jgi:hypothetical protein
MKERRHKIAKQYRDARAAGQRELFPPIAPKLPFDPDRTRPLPPLPPLLELEQRLADVRKEVRNLILMQLREQDPRKRQFLFNMERSARAETRMRADAIAQARLQEHSAAARERWAAAEAASTERKQCVAEHGDGRG